MGMRSFFIELTTKQCDIYEYFHYFACYYQSLVIFLVLPMMHYEEGERGSIGRYHVQEDRARSLMERQLSWR